MADVPEIVAAVKRRLSAGGLAGRKVVVTAGPTFEPIDPVRFLGNRSSGKMGFAIAAEAARRGARVELIAGPVSLATPARVVRTDVQTALEMESAVRRHAGDADVIVMAAAVADYRPKRAAQEKLKKSEGPPEIELIANPDILGSLLALAPQALRVGFAAETQGVEAEARRKLEQKGAHLLVANDVGRTDIGFASDENEVTLFARDAPPELIGKRSKAAVAAALVDRIERELEALRGRSAPAAG
jgi:phosphopantothenoylcysteine decarboxylase/phosphopantothenate--cysteine ligase